MTNKDRETVVNYRIEKADKTFNEVDILLTISFGILQLTGYTMLVIMQLLHY